MSLGRVEDNKLEQLSEAISKHLETVNIFNLSKEIDISDTYILGPLLVLERMLETMGIKTALQNVLSQHKKLQFDFEKVIFTQLCSRFIKPVSKLSLYDNWVSRMLFPWKLQILLPITNNYGKSKMLLERLRELLKPVPCSIGMIKELSDI